MAFTLHPEGPDSIIASSFIVGDTRDQSWEDAMPLVVEIFPLKSFQVSHGMEAGV